MIVRIIMVMFLFLVGASVSAQEERASQDTLRTEAIHLDSLVVSTDSLQTESLHQSADSLVLKVESLKMQPDSSAVRADSLAINVDSLVVPVDSLVVPIEKPKVKKKVRDNRNAKIMKAFTASMNKLSKEFFDYMHEQEKPESTLYRSVKLSTDYYRLFVPATFYISPLEVIFEIILLL